MIDTATPRLRALVDRVAVAAGVDPREVTVRIEQKSQMWCVAYVEWHAVGLFLAECMGGESPDAAVDAMTRSYLESANHNALSLGRSASETDRKRAMWSSIREAVRGVVPGDAGADGRTPEETPPRSDDTRYKRAAAALDGVRNALGRRAQKYARDTDLATMVRELAAEVDAVFVEATEATQQRDNLCGALPKCRLHRDRTATTEFVEDSRPFCDECADPEGTGSRHAAFRDLRWGDAVRAVVTAQRKRDGAVAPAVERDAEMRDEIARLTRQLDEAHAAIRAGLHCDACGETATRHHHEPSRKHGPDDYACDGHSFPPDERGGYWRDLDHASAVRAATKAGHAGYSAG